MYIGNMAELGLGWVQYISGADADFVKGGCTRCACMPF